MRKSGGSVSNACRRPAISPEARENQMVTLAIDLAEKQLRDGTASSQVITHFLKIASGRERLERDILAQQRELMEAKTDAIKSRDHLEEIYTNAVEAMKRYSGAE